MTRGCQWPCSVCLVPTVSQSPTGLFIYLFTIFGCIGSLLLCTGFL